MVHQYKELIDIVHLVETAIMDIVHGRELLFCKSVPGIATDSDPALYDQRRLL